MPCAAAQAANERAQEMERTHREEQEAMKELAESQVGSGEMAGSFKMKSLVQLVHMECRCKAAPVSGHTNSVQAGVHVNVEHCLAYMAHGSEKVLALQNELSEMRAQRQGATAQATAVSQVQ
eukprot:scaffold275850_cov18-Tisochrysis_lutea.AAC.1